MNGGSKTPELLSKLYKSLDPQRKMELGFLDNKPNFSLFMFELCNVFSASLQ